MQLSSEKKGWLLAILIMMTACATPPPPPPPVSPIEQIQRDNALGLDLARSFEPGFKVRHEAAVSNYLESVGKSLVASVPELKSSPLEVRLIAQTRDPWRSYSLPGIRVYLSTQLLKGLKFENEIAAVLALELSHVLKRSVVNRLPAPGANPEATKAPDFFGRGGLFDFSQQQWLDALPPAIEMMYTAGYDPRGMVNLLSHFAKSSSRSPIPPQIVAGMIENTRRIIALHSPLRNPIVRSEAFLAIQKRIQGL